MPRGNVIPAYAGLQRARTSWMPACAGMTIALRTPYVNTPECITRSKYKRVELKAAVNWPQPHVSTTSS